MACAPENVTLWLDERLELERRSMAEEIDVTRRLKALPEPELPAGLEQRVREFLHGRRGFAGH